ncbi:MAG TPA: ADOP family duplicated permease [Bryobacteraceae bacterium]|nr:ADOP family duplicated permease [Bryobacteraceae bacterium]
MNWWQELARKAGFIRKRNAFSGDLENEMQFHLETRAEELIAAGMRPREARAQAQREFGPKLRVHEDSRAAWQVQWLEDVFSDLKYAGRALRRSPGFAFAAVMSLALGIGANTTIFSLTMEFLFSNPSCRDGASLRYVLLGRNSHSEIDRYQFLRDSQAFAGVAGSNEETEANWRNGASTERIWAVNATDNFFDVVGVPVAFGRPIHTGEQNEVVLNYGFWKGKLGGNTDIIGRRLVLDGDVYTIVGVLPPDHRSLTGFGFSPDLYKTFREAKFPLAIYVRLADGMSSAECFTRLQQLVTQLNHIYPPADARQMNDVEIRQVAGMGRLRSISMVPLTAFFGMLLLVVGLVLLIACANVASLLLARAASRQQELSIRQAIGAGRGRIVRQLLAESLLLAALGTTAGLALNVVTSVAMNGIRLPLPLPLRLHIEPDWRLLSYSIALTAISALLCGLLPALKATRRDVNPGLKIGERQTGGRARMQRFLVTGQLALSVLLLSVSFLFLKNLLSAASMSPGFDVHHTVWAYMRLVPSHYVKREQIDAVVRTSLEKLRALPGVESAATLEIVPLNGNRHNTTDARTDDRATAQIIRYEENSVGPDYFKTMGIPLIAGREFLASDTHNAPAVVILNNTLAHQLFRDKNAVGHTIRQHSGPPQRVVGVAKDSKYFTLGAENVPAMYLCYFQSNSEVVNLNFMARSALPSGSLVKETSETLTSIDRTAALEVKPMQKAMAFAMLPSQVGATLLGSMGLLALLLAAVGIYGVLIYSVNQRLREFGLRMALGAARGAVVQLVLQDSSWMLVGGTAAGLLLAFVATPTLSSFLTSEVSAHDVTAFVLTVAVLGTVALAASISPIVRAVRVDPAVALRYE